MEIGIPQVVHVDGDAMTVQVANGGEDVGRVPAEAIALGDDESASLAASKVRVVVPDHPRCRPER